jgi:hypothetical protein
MLIPFQVIEMIEVSDDAGGLHSSNELTKVAGEE